MPRTRILFFRESDGSAPLRSWLMSLWSKPRSKCLDRIEMLARLGHELRRPEADYLRDGIYELRASLAGTHYRVLYFFGGRGVAVLSHGIIKEDRVPAREIATAIWRKKRFEQDPQRYSQEAIDA